MSVNNISFFGSNNYNHGTSAVKPKNKNNFKQQPRGQFKTYDMHKNFALYHGDNDLKYIPISNKKPKNNDKKILTRAQAVRKHKRKQAERRAKTVAAMIPTIPAAMLATYFALSNPQDKPIYTPIVEQVDVDAILNESQKKADELKILTKSEIPLTVLVDSKHKIYEDDEIEEAEVKEAEIYEDEEAIDAEQQDEMVSTMEMYKGGFDFDLCVNPKQEKGVRNFINTWNDPDKRQRYINVANQTGIPAELIAAIHYREANCNFDKSQVDGESLEDTDFASWEDSAVYAFTKTGQDISIIEGDDIGSWLEFAERYNGLGYRNAGINSPYIWSGTVFHTSGKFTDEHVYDETAIDNQPGIAIMLRELFIGDVLSD